MLKISQTGKASHPVTLKLEGRVVGEWVAELRQLCELILSEGRKLKLDLTDVSYVDAVGVTTLASFKTRGVALKNCSPFVDEQLKSAAHG